MKSRNVGLLEVSKPEPKEVPEERIKSPVVNSVAKVMDNKKDDTAVYLNPFDVEPSFMRDRYDMDPEAREKLDQLKASIRDMEGNYAPAAVRPHPKERGKYQLVFGHRRHQAIKELANESAEPNKWLLKAFINSVSDEELLLLQTSENAERLDLTYIERASWAHSLLKNTGLTQKDIAPRLGLEKASLSKMLSTVTNIPEDVRYAIGRAEGVGEPRWMALSKFLKNEHLVDLIRLEIGKPDFPELSSKERMERALLVMKQATTAANKAAQKSKKPAPKAQPSVPAETLMHNGRQIGMARTSQAGMHLTISSENAEFGEWIKQKMSDLYEEFATEMGEGTSRVDSSMDMRP
ncbi:plasmid partitioning protein RepB [Roseibium sp. RKSG952]|uniref:plasmid partitioning protein RepB n=1 Tax=Roseibium sp. RKSG952 TaxID=2529384 RepID=UPI0012BCB523|nr:plasmid partitioning protein RepB [Roseibium sp. RKSG952]MTH96692.1 plasmid partitioning protein RepB [Roseibium sp. RKSG952]